MKTIVIKLGGSILEHLDSTFFHDCQQLLQEGFYPIIVHGGGPMISEHLNKLGIQTRFINGRRYTDQRNLQHVIQSLAGDVNKQLVSRFIAEEISAIGISGIDLQLLKAQPKDPRFGFVGEVVDVHTEVLITLLAAKWIPVIAPLGLDHNGQAYNINADEAASAIADAVGAEKLVMVSDVPGVIIQGEKMDQLTTQQIDHYIQTGEITGGMIPKVQAGTTALQGAISEVVILSGHKKHPLTSQGTGTRLLSKGAGNHVIIS
ncbi:N-acetylglutamate kinase [Seinonella peptonophila]|uniref:Acetylglutamate kinase n=1 Tax=Seinonella peptonophila TaxID=112248 RepID=A0A1M4XQV6_9BACL|nr:acetylglutamate kinase [Seinonella peptonophila]SHE95756.1 N-acetylglutamate kinase [Seinonella peptonophila]